MTTLINLYGAPCSGKSVKMLQLAALAKMRGHFCEICPEVAKEYVVQGIAITGAVQRELTREQMRRLQCFAGNVELLITDAPPLIGAFYAEFHRMENAAAIAMEFQRYRERIAGRIARTLNVYCWRDHPYVCAGRVETEGEDAEIARRMWQFVQQQHGDEPLLEVKSTDDPGVLLDRLLAQR